MAMQPRLWTVNGLSVELGVDRRTTAKRLALVPTAGEIGGHAAWLMADAAPAVLKIPGSLLLGDERARLAKEQADGLAMKNAQLRGELLPRDEVAAAVQAAFSRVKAKLLAIPTKSAPVLAGVASPMQVKTRLTESIHEALAELKATEVVSTSSRGDLYRFEDGRRGNRLVASAGPTADSDRQRMGRSVSPDFK
jgi:hypothetical protein